MMKSIKIVILLVLLLVSQQKAWACGHGEPYDPKLKWEINPTIVFDEEFARYPGVAEKAVEMINEHLGSIQLIPDYEYDEDFIVTIRSYWEKYYDISGYQRYQENLEDDNPNSILVALDDHKSGFGASFSPVFGWVRLDGERYAELAYDVKVNVLVHEILHALNTRHQLRVIDGGSLIALGSIPAMYKYVRRTNFILTNTDINAMYRLYGKPCHDESHIVDINLDFDNNSLAVALIPAKKRIKRLIRRDFGNRIKRKYTDRVNTRGVILGIKDSEAQVYVPSGNYILQVRPTGGYDDDDTFRPDIEGGTPSLDRSYYVRYRGRYRDYVLTTKLRKATKIPIRNNMEIEISGFLE